MALLEGLEILGHQDAAAWLSAIEKTMKGLVEGILGTERGVRDGLDKQLSPDKPFASELLVSFLMSFASRAASREPACAV